MLIFQVWILDCSANYDGFQNFESSCGPHLIVSSIGYGNNKIVNLEIDEERIKEEMKAVRFAIT